MCDSVVVAAGMRRVLRRLGHVSEDGVIGNKGRVACEVRARSEQLANDVRARCTQMDALRWSHLDLDASFEMARYILRKFPLLCRVVDLAVVSTSDELLITELVFTGIFQTLQPVRHHARVERSCIISKTTNCRMATMARAEI
eukprot:123393-Pleurochrysis_carterae.AAC.1